MRKFLLMIVLTAFSLPIYSQIYLAGRDINKVVRDSTILIYVGRPACPTKAYYKLTDRCAFLGGDQIVITDATGKPIKFNAVPEVIDLFERNGWKYRDNFTTVYNGDGHLYLIFERKR